MVAIKSLLLLFLCCAVVPSTLSSHFRGGIVMVRPAPGGAFGDVSVTYLALYYTDKITACRLAKLVMQLRSYSYN